MPSAKVGITGGNGLYDILKDARTKQQGGGMMKVTELSTDELKVLIQEAIEEKLFELFGDPDKGLELREEVKEQLKESLAAAKRGEGKPIEQVAKELGLKYK